MEILNNCDTKDEFVKFGIDDLDNIYVYEDKKIKIKFKYEDEYNYLIDFVKRRKNFLS